MTSPSRQRSDSRVRRAQPTHPRPRARRVLALASALAMALTACAGVSPGGDADGDVELVWAIGGPGAQPGGTFQLVTEMWNEENPDVPVSIDILPEDADEQRVQQSLVLNAAGSDFDVLSMDVIWTGEYAQNGWIVDWEEQRAELEDAVLAGPLESAQYQGQLWAVPFSSNASFLYYRTDLIDEPPTTWDELREVGLEAAEEAGIAPFVAQGARYEGFVVNFLEYYWSAGGELYDEDNTEVLWPSGDAAATALEYMRSAFEDGVYAPGFNTAMEEEARNEFQSGNAVFMRQWPYAYELIREDAESPIRDDFDIAPLPTFDGDGTISALGGYNNAVSVYSEHEEEAREFVLWLSTTPEVQQLMGERADPPVLAEAYDALADDPVMALLGEVLPESRARPPIPQYSTVSDVMQRELFPGYMGDADPEAAIAAVRDALEDALPEQ
jgi:multiple sugar transport system substrate-binding protein